MTSQTWGLHIRGYSDPSPAQVSLFARRHPGAVALHNLDLDHAAREKSHRAGKIDRMESLCKQHHGLGCWMWNSHYGCSRVESSAWDTMTVWKFKEIIEQPCGTLGAPNV